MTESIINLQKVALIGFGRWGQNIARCLKNLGVLRTIVEISPEARAAARMQYGVEVLYGYAHEAFSRITEPAVVIATPPETHYHLTKSVLLAGKDVFVEKPFTLEYAQAEELVGLAESTERILMVGHILAYDPIIRAFVRRAGAIEPIEHILIYRNVSRQLAPDESLWWTQAPHDVWLMQALGGGGGPLNPVHRTNRGARVVWGGEVVTRYDLTNNWEHETYRRCSVVGKGVEMHYTDRLPPRNQLSVVRRDSVKVEVAESPTIPYAEPLTIEMQHFLDCITTRSEPETSGRKSLPVMETLCEVGRHVEHTSK